MGISFDWREYLFIHCIGPFTFEVRFEVSMWLIFKTEMLIYQSKANLDGINLFRKITHRLDPEIRKMLVIDMFGNENSTFHCGP